MTGWLPETLGWEGCLNARDLGGMRTTAGRTIRSGALIRADCPSYLTTDGVAALRAVDPSLVVDLRFPGERLPGGVEGIAHPYGDDVRYRALPLFDPATSEIDPHVVEAMSMAELYCSILDRNGSRITAAVRGIAADGPPGPVVVHCVSGKDRTGIIIALVLGVAGVPDADIVADYAASYPLLADRMAADLAALGAAPEDVTARRAARQRTEPKTMRTMLEHLDRRHGGVHAYLSGSGMTQSEFDALRVFLLEPAR